MSQTLTVLPAAERRLESMTSMSCTTVSEPVAELPPGELRGTKGGRERRGEKKKTELNDEEVEQFI